jgi:hypothetical protein
MAGGTEENHEETLRIVGVPPRFRLSISKNESTVLPLCNPFGKINFGA